MKVRRKRSEVLARRSPTRNSKRYLAQLFSLIAGDGQPTAQIRCLVGEADDARLLGAEPTKGAPLGGYTTMFF